jgi:hypothetical protein
MSEFQTPPPAEDDWIGSIKPEERRRPGRPRKEETTTNSNPEDAVKPKKERAQRRKKSQVSSEEIKQRAQMYAGAHFALAMFAQAPELMLSEEQAMALASSSIQVENEFGIEIDSKWMAIATLLATVGGIYGPKLVQIKMRVDAQRAQAKAQNDAGLQPSAMPDPGHQVYPMQQAAE